MALVANDHSEILEDAVGKALRGDRVLTLLQMLGLLVLAAGCQQQVTTLSGWATEGSESTIVLLERTEEVGHLPQVELASAPVVGAAVSVQKRERGKDRAICDVQTDGSGHFSASILREPGGRARWQLTVAKVGYEPASTGWRRLPGGNALCWQVFLARETQGKSQ